MVLVILLAGYANAFVRWGEKDEKGRNRQRNNQKRKADETDLYNLLSQCTGLGGPQVPSLFGGMFLSPTEIDDLVRDTQDEISPVAERRHKSKYRYVETNRVSRVIGKIQTFAAPTTTADEQTCCQTELKVTAPGTVMEDGKSLSVVHMNHSYQYIQEGECVKSGTPCRGIGICTQIYKYAFMLLYDETLIGQVNPPVRYGRVSVKSHCECMNIGRVMK